MKSDATTHGGAVFVVRVAGTVRSIHSVDGPSSDPTARLEWLERWASEQQERIDQRPTRRIRQALARAPQQLGHQKPLGRLANRILDRGLNTSGDSDQPETALAGRQRYVPSAWHVLPRALHYLGVSDRDTFVEFGCGKGRVVHQAARRPFRRVVGVEISPALAEIARAGLAARRHQHRCRNVEIVVADLKDFRVPDDLTIGYFFDPVGRETFSAVLQGVVDSIDRNPRRVRLIYVRPTLGSQVLATGRFRLVKEQRGGLRDARIYRAAIFESL
jgi:SAM-dependent methyltransferase